MVIFTVGHMDEIPMQYNIEAKKSKLQTVIVGPKIDIDEILFYRNG